MEGMEEMWEKLQLTTEEDQYITINEEDLEVPQPKSDCYLVKKVWIECSIRQKIIEGVMGKIWRLNAIARFKEMAPNTFIISFANKEDRIWGNMDFCGHLIIIFSQFKSLMDYYSQKRLIFILLLCGCNFITSRSMG